VDTTPKGVQTRCSELAELGVRFFMAASPSNLANFDLEPLGTTLTPLRFLTAEWHHDDLLRLWNQMDAYAFGPREMPMPNWVLVDHALMASGLMIAAVAREDLDAILTRFTVGREERGILDLVLADIDALGYDGLVPVAGYCAAPTADRDRWMGWSMCSAIPHAGLGFTSKALGLEAYRAKVVTGVTQWDNLSIRSHVKFGPARVESATLDLHTAPGSFVYSTDIEAWRSAGQTSDPTTPEEPSFLVSARDRERHLELQRAIEAGEQRLEIIEPGMILRDGEHFVPVRVTHVNHGAADA
jgi:hypothetical protein